jgi:hypothetical protein
MEHAAAPSQCPSCGYVGVDADLPGADRVVATPACYACFSELTGGHTLVASGGDFIHQVALDAYLAQHCPFGAHRTLVFSLAGLYLIVEEGRTGRQVQQVHQALAATAHPLPALEPVDAHGAGTVADVLAQIPRDGLVPSVNGWAARMWQAYAARRPEIEQWAAGWPQRVVAAARR